MRVKLGIVGGSIETLEVADGITVGALLDRHGLSAPTSILVGGIAATPDRVLGDDDVVLVRGDDAVVAVDVSAVADHDVEFVRVILPYGAARTAESILLTLAWNDVITLNPALGLATPDGAILQPDEGVRAGAVLNVVDLDETRIEFRIRAPGGESRSAFLLPHPTDTLRTLLAKLWSNDTSSLLTGAHVIPDREFGTTMVDLGEAPGPIIVWMADVVEIIPCNATGAPSAPPLLFPAGTRLREVLAVTGVAFDPAAAPRDVATGASLAEDTVLAAGRRHLTDVAPPAAATGIPVDIGVVGTSCRRIRLPNGSTVADASVALFRDDPTFDLAAVTAMMDGREVDLWTVLVPNARIDLRVTDLGSVRTAGPPVNVRAGVIPGRIQDLELPAGATVGDVAAQLGLPAGTWTLDRDGLTADTPVTEGQRLFFRRTEARAEEAFRLSVTIRRDVTVMPGQTVADVLFGLGCPDAVVWRDMDAVGGPETVAHDAEAEILRHRAGGPVIDVRS
jgi:hypothetical protein